MLLCGIYILKNCVTGKVYIGSSRDCSRRKSEHLSRLRRGAHINAKLQASWKKHGEAAFEWVVVCSVLNPNDLEIVEQEFLDAHNAVENGYNLAPTAGNTAGWKASPETRKRMSEAAKKRDNSAQVAAMATASRGKKRPQHVIDAMQEGKRQKPLSDASRKKMSQAAVKRSRYDDDARKRMAEMKNAGVTLRAIAKTFGTTSHDAIRKYIIRWEQKHANA